MRSTDSGRRCGTHDRLEIASASKYPPCFPHANKVMHPVNRFFINGKWLNLYTVRGRTPSTQFSLYWQDEQNPVQHAMNTFEVFAVLADLLRPYKSFVSISHERKESWTCEIDTNCHRLGSYLALTAKETDKINEDPSCSILSGITMLVGQETLDFIVKNKLGKLICDNCLINFRS